MTAGRRIFPSPPPPLLLLLSATPTRWDAFLSLFKPLPSLNPRWRSLDQTRSLARQNTPALQASPPDRPLGLHADFLCIGPLDFLGSHFRLIRPPSSLKIWPHSCHVTTIVHYSTVTIIAPLPPSLPSQRASTLRYEKNTRATLTLSHNIGLDNLRMWLTIKRVSKGYSHILYTWQQQVRPFPMKFQSRRTNCPSF